VIAAGAMFKGQQLFVAPMFILWPIFIGRPGKALRWAIGLVLGVGVIASPWLISYVPGGVTFTSTGADRVLDRGAIIWLVWLALVTIAWPPLLRWIWPWRASRLLPAVRWSIWVALMVVGFVGALWPFLSDANRGYLLFGVAIALIVVVAGQFLIWRWRLYLSAGAIGTGLLLCALLFNGNMNWFYIGWGYGTRHYYRMTQGVSDNLAGILHERYGWENIDEAVYTFDAHPTRLWPTHTVVFDQPWTMTIRELLALIYVVTFLISVVGIALQYKRNDPRFLVAVAAPWLMFFTFLPQIHERYLLYAAGVGCCLTAVSLGTTLINLFFTALTTIMTLHVMLVTARNNGYMHDFGNSVSPTFKRTLLRSIQATYPDAGWAVILAAGIVLYLCIAPSPRRRPKLLSGRPAIDDAEPAAQPASPSIEPTLAIEPAADPLQGRVI
jgi:hypothetical protein